MACDGENKSGSSPASDPNAAGSFVRNGTQASIEVVAKTLQETPSAPAANDQLALTSLEEQMHQMEAGLIGGFTNASEGQQPMKDLEKMVAELQIISALLKGPEPSAFAKSLDALRTQLTRKQTEFEQKCKTSTSGKSAYMAMLKEIGAMQARLVAVTSRLQMLRADSERLTGRTSEWISIYRDSVEFLGEPEARKKLKALMREDPMTAKQPGAATTPKESGTSSDPALRVPTTNARTRTDTSPSVPTAKVTQGAKVPPFVNSLGMRFVPVKITEGESAVRQVWFSIWETRVQDYRKYAAAKRGVNDEWKSLNLKQGEDHPVANVNLEDAVTFCKWLTQQERSAGKILPTAKYRLPTDHEWSCAVGIGDREDAAATPQSKDDKIGDVYPWGSQWPPPKGSGNYDPTLKVDSYEKTSPVGSFAANLNGLYDLGGNVWEWCEDPYNASCTPGVVRGGGWGGGDRTRLRSAYRGIDNSRSRYRHIGFRVVFVVGDGQAP